MSENKFYRPEWTLGKYDNNKKIAIYYNLIEGESYFFEDYSAEVVSHIVSTKPNLEIIVEDISKKTNIDVESIISFFEELISYGLLIKNIPSKDYIENYRRITSEKRVNKSINADDSYNQYTIIQNNSAESEFINRTEGISCVMFELTYNCSAKCIHCYNVGATRNDNEISYRNNRDELNFNDYKNLIDQLIDKGLFRVILSGGDPFSNSNVWQIIEYLHKKEIAFDIFTNGINLINKVDKLSKYYPRSVGISLHSGIKEVHDSITRVKGSWAKTISVIKSLSEHSIPFNIKCSVMMPNFKSYHTVKDIAKEYGSIAQLDVCITDSIEGDKCVSENLRLSPEILEIVLRDKNIALYVGNERENYGGVTKNLNYNACGAGYNSFCITPEGNFIGCCAFHEMYGNIKSDKIENILSSAKLKKWQNLKLNDYEDCGKHDYCNFCNLCVGNNYAEHGNVLKCGENNLYIAKARYELSKKISLGKDPLRGKTVQECLECFPDFKNKELKRNIKQ